MLLFFFILAFRDIVLITMGVYLMLKQDRVFESNLVGKWFVFTTSLMMLSFILNLNNLYSYILYLISFILFVFSTYFYVKRYMKIFKELENSDVLSF